MLKKTALALALMLAACDNGYSTQEAVARCDVEQENKPEITDEIYASCVACFEACGDECQPQDSSPESYACPP
jgi:hypothetical protein